MDDKKLEQLFREGLKNLSKKEYPVQGWESVQQAIPGNRLIYWKKQFSNPRLLAPLCLLLILAQVIQTGFLFKKDREIAGLKGILAQKNTTLSSASILEPSEDTLRVAMIRDTIYVMLYPSSENISSTTLAAPGEKISAYAAGYEANFPDTNRVAFAVSPTETRVVNPDTFTKDSTLLAENIGKKPTAVPVVKKSKRNKTSFPELSLRNWSARIGGGVSQTFVAPQFGFAKASVSPQFLLQFRKNKESWGVQTGLNYLPLHFHADPGDIIKFDPSREKVSLYPEIASFGSLEKLHKIQGSLVMVEIPIGFYYTYYDTRTMKLKFDISSSLLRMGKTHYTYEFHKPDGNKTYEYTYPGDWSWGTISGGTSMEFLLNKNVWGKIGLQYQHYILPQGPEKRRYELLGISAGVLLGK
ncbi:MAG: hypothetical protein SF052_09610 [Bacteroidia bacterium]|nr:hypothetical protein [Bacteroidia bacterium]